MFLVLLLVVQPALAGMIDEDAPIVPKTKVEIPLEQPLAPESTPEPAAVKSGSTWYWWVLGGLVLAGAAAAAGGGGGGGGSSSSTPPPDTTSVTATW